MTRRSSVVLLSVPNPKVGSVLYINSVFLYPLFYDKLVSYFPGPGNAIFLGVWNLELELNLDPLIQVLAVGIVDLLLKVDLLLEGLNVV